MQSLLFLGASGQVGGAFLPVFRKQYPEIPVTVYLRRDDLDTALKALGNIAVVHGSFSELEAVHKLAASHSIIINSASSQDTALTEAIIRGVRDRKAATGSNSILYHLSGAGNFVDNSETGNYVPTEHRFDDTNPDDVHTITAEMQPNGPCDELIFKAAAAGEVDAFIVCPGAIYGNSANHIGLAANSSTALAPGVWINYMISNIEALGFAPYVGEGTSRFGVVHVDDVVDLMMLVFQKALDSWATYKPEDVYKHFYIVVAKEEQSKALQTALVDVVFRRGKIAAPTVKSVPYAEAGFVARYIAGNMLVDSNNAKSLGWKAQYPDIFEVLKQTK